MLKAALRPAVWRGRALRDRAASLVAEPQRRPIVVLGNHKSGTTAVAALLAAHLETPVQLDMPVLTHDPEDGAALERFVRRYAVYFSRPVVKEPWLTLAYADLRFILPGARFVLVVRDPRDTIRSILDRLDLPSNAAGNPPGLADVPRGWRPMFPSGDDPDAPHYIDALAARWEQIALLPRNAAPAAPEVLRYEDFAADKAGAVARLAERLGTPGHGAIGHLAARSYQPTGRQRGRPWQTVFGADNLARIEATCRNGMAFHGYGASDAAKRAG